MSIEVPPVTWRKSTHSGANNDCVEVAGNLPGAVAVRDSKDRVGPVLVFTRRDWNAFVTGAKDGEFDLR